MDSNLRDLPVKCRKCRFHLCSYSSVLDSHGKEVSSITSSNKSHPCSTDVWYIPEDKVPDWMKVHVDNGEWIKGKMSCPNCQARIGSYNFVSGMKCTCGLHILPPIHLVKSKVDVILPVNNLQFAQPYNVVSLQLNSTC